MFRSERMKRMNFSGAFFSKAEKCTHKPLSNHDAKHHNLKKGGKLPRTNRQLPAS
jgi:hypothetical protein